MTDSLDILLEKEAVAFEDLASAVIHGGDVSGAFVRFSMARNKVTRELAELRKDFSNRFAGTWDFNETPTPPLM